MENMKNTIPMPKRQFLSWMDVDKLIDRLIPQFDREFTAMVIITRGGIIPGGLLAEALQITHVLTAAVDFPAEVERNKSLMAWPEFIQFPMEEKLKGHSILIVDDVWGSGRTITAVKNKVSAAGGFPDTCVLHYNPYRTLFGTVKPDYFAEQTDARVIYPWEIDRGSDKEKLPEQL
jgi:hypoxanthine phosphoribosyltransferase